jgi:hypothetical protein
MLWTEADMAYFKVRSRNLSAVADKNHEKLQSEFSTSGPNSEPGTSWTQVVAYASDFPGAYSHSTLRKMVKMDSGFSFLIKIRTLDL